MSEVLNRLQERFRSAEADVDAAKRRARQTSAARLQELLAEPSASARVAGVNDPVLTAFDRGQLERAIAEEIPSRRRRVPSSISALPRTAFRHAGYHRRKIVYAALFAVPFAALGITAALRTPSPAKRATVTAEFDVSWTMTSGPSRTERLRPGDEVVWFARDGKNYLRRWFPGRGYGEVAVDDRFVQYVQLR